MDIHFLQGVPKHVPRLAGLSELPLESLALVLGVGVVALNVRAGACPEWQQEAVQVATVAHQLRVVRRPVAPCLVVTRPQLTCIKHCKQTQECEVSYQFVLWLPLLNSLQDPLRQRCPTLPGRKVQDRGQSCILGMWPCR